jgi:hypothetical protein
MNTPCDAISARTSRVFILPEVILPEVILPKVIPPEVLHPL